ncbi:MAG: GIY-YIG nuclease family protein [Candidatus Delongbacteria bacterium]|jgi:putative endonuclease|nr:GIY-YIG nuclease family protein [Candidatus Delongbacteria bacterium]
MNLYIVKCEDGKFYTGVTNNLQRRLNEHNIGICKTSYTYNRRPVVLVFSTFFNDPNDAIIAEKQIKGWNKAKKEALIDGDFEELIKLSSVRK